MPLGLAVVAAVGHFLYLREFTMDDAAISFSYARTWAGRGSLGELFVGDFRVEGYSNFTWVALLAAAERVGLSAINASKLLGLGALVGSVVLVHRLAVLGTGRRWLGIVAIAVSTTTNVALWSASGLENAFYMFVALVAAVLLCREDERCTVFPWSAPAVVVLAATRPEGAVFVGAALAYKFIALALDFRSRDRRRLRLVAAAKWGAAVAVLAAGYFLWHLGYYGHLFPNTVEAKTGTPQLGTLVRNAIDLDSPTWSVIRGFGRTYTIWPAVMLAGVGALVALADRRRVVPLFFLAALALPLYAQDWMVHYRFFTTLVPFGAILGAFGIDAIIRLAAPSGAGVARRRMVTGAALIATVVILIAHALPNARMTREARRIDFFGYVTMEQASGHVNALQISNLVGIRRPLVLIPDIGGPSYQLWMRIVDLLGLTDYHVARSLGDQPILTQYLISEVLPDAIVTYGGYTCSTFGSTATLAPHYLPSHITNPSAPCGSDGYFLRKSAVVTPTVDVGDRVGPLRLHRIEVPTAVAAGGLLEIDAFWSRETPDAHGIVQRLQLIDATGRARSEQSAVVGYGWYPPEAWQQGEMLRQRTRLPVDVPDGAYRLRISLERDGNELGVWEGQAIAVGRGPALRAHEKCVREARSHVADDPERAFLVLDRCGDLLPGDAARSKHERAGRSLEDAVHQALLKRIELAAKQHDAAALLRTSSLLRRLPITARGGGPAEAVASRLARLGAEARSARDLEYSYALFVAASYCDPSNVDLMKALERARRDYVRLG